MMNLIHGKNGGLSAAINPINNFIEQQTAQMSQDSDIEFIDEHDSDIEFLDSSHDSSVEWLGY